MKLHGHGTSLPTDSVQRSGAAIFRKARGVAALSGALLAVAAAAVAPTPANAAEHQLVGIRIFASSREVLSHFGNPTQILTGAAAIQGPAVTGGAGSMGSPYGPMGPMGPMGPPRGPMGARGAMGPFGPGRGNEFGGPTGGMPPMGPYGPMGPAAGMGQNAQGSGNPVTDAQMNEAMYVYERPNGLTLEFLLSPDGRVIQITVLGYKSGTRTARGIALGSSYSEVIDKYGYPESQDAAGGILTMKYLQKEHVSFQLRNDKVVGITIAAVD